MKNIMFLCNWAPVYTGNFLPSIMTLENRLKSLGYSCTYVFPFNAKERPWYDYMIQKGCQVDFIEFRVKRFYQPDFEFIKDLEKLAEKYDIDLIHFHFCETATLSLFSLRNRKIKVLGHIHSDFSLGNNGLKTKIKNLVCYRLMRGRVDFASVGEYMCKYNPKHIIYIPNALALDRMPSDSIESKELKKLHGINEDQIVFETFGWYPSVKGTDIAVDVIGKARAKYNLPLTLVIICGEDDTSTRNFIKEHTEYTGDEEWIKYFPPREDVFSYHGMADYLISSSRSDAFSYVLLEMLSLGKTCVISDIPGQRWAKKYRTVFDFDINNELDGVEAVHEAVLKGKKIDKEVSSCVLKDYDIDRWCESIIDFYMKISSLG